MSYSPSKRASPFRRPESPSPSTATAPSGSSPRPSTPNYQSSHMPSTPSKLHNSSVPNDDGSWSPSTTHNLRSGGGGGVTAREAPMSPVRSPSFARVPAAGPSPTMGMTTNGTTTAAAAAAKTAASASPLPSSPRTAISAATTTTTTAAPSAAGRATYGADALARLPTAQVRELREAFQILDRNGDGQVERDDVADMLGQLGLDDGGGAAAAAAVAPYFPPQAPHPLPMAAYLGSLSASLARLSPPQELLAALSAFDDDDSGQLDVADLTDALLHTAPEPGDEGYGKKPLDRAEIAAIMQDFTGKRAFSKYAPSGLGGNKGEVFRYRDWVSNLGPVGNGQGEKMQAA